MSGERMIWVRKLAVSTMLHLVQEWLVDDILDSPEEYQIWG